MSGVGAAIRGFSKKFFSGSKQKTTGTEVIKSVKAKVNKTKSDEGDSRLALARAKLKASQAKLGQTMFEIENKRPLSFKYQGGIKTPKNSDKKIKTD
jgi:hypothetical protein